MWNSYIEDYCNLVHKLSDESLLKTQIVRELDFDADGILKRVATENLTKYRKCSNGMWIDYHLKSKGIEDIQFFLQKINRIVDNNQKKSIRIHKLNDFFQDASWNYFETIEIVKGLLKTNFPMYPQLEFMKMEAVLKESKEYLLSGKGDFEYRYNCELLVVVEVKDKLSNNYEAIGLTMNKNTDIQDLEKEINEALTFMELVYSLPECKIEQCFENDGKAILCVARPEFSGRLIHESVGHFTEADVFEQSGQSIDVLGRKIAISQLNIVDYANGLKIPYQYFLDEEGMIAQDMTVMQGGKITGLLSDQQSLTTEFHKAFGFVRSSVKPSHALIRMRNTALLPSEEDVTNTLSSIEEGLLLSQYSDGYLGLQSQFNIRVKNAIVIKSGNYVGVIKDLELTSSVIDFLSSISFVGNDFKWFSNLSCTKEDSIVPISFGSPTITCVLNARDL